MRFYFWAALANFICISSAASRADNITASHGPQPARSCASYEINFPVTTATTIFWTNGGGTDDSEWINVDNWQYDYLPGVHKYNKLIMAVKDKATVYCPATYMKAKIDLEMRARATLDVQSDLNIGGKLVLKSNAVVTQSSQSVVSIGESLYLSAMYDISDQAQLVVGTNVYVHVSGRLAINGDSSKVSAVTSSEMLGWLTYRFGPSGAGVLDVNGMLTIGSNAQLVIDASSYESSGSATIQLIKYTSNTGSFGPDNIQITGMADGLTPLIKSESDGLYIQMTQDPTGGPVAQPTEKSDCSDVDDWDKTTDFIKGDQAVYNEVLYEVRKKHKNKRPDKWQNKWTALGECYQERVDCEGLLKWANTKKYKLENQVIHEGYLYQAIKKHKNKDPIKWSTRPKESTNKWENLGLCEEGKSPSESPTLSPTNVISSGPSVSPSSSPTDSSPQGPTTTIVLDASGVDPIITDQCQFEDNAELVIDGSAYTAGPATITLYQCTGGNSGYDAMNIKLIGFQTGWWFEITNSNNKIELMIKSLDDYSQYWARVKFSYTGDYPFQTYTDDYPEFSWDTVQRWISFRKNPVKGPFTEEEIESIAVNNRISWFGLGRPEEVITMAESIKDINPKYKMLLYWNAESYWGSDIDTFNEDWLKDGAGGTGNRPSYDHSIPEMREWWVNHAVTMDNHPAIDGVFSDNTRIAANTDKSRMIKLLADSLPEESLKMGNFLRQRDDDGNRWRMDYEDGSYFENQHIGPFNQPEHESIIVSMQLAREASWKRKLVMWNGSRRNCGCGTIPPNQVPEACVGFMNVDEAPEEKITEDLNRSLAEYLMIAEEHSYFAFNISPDAACERWRWDSSSMPQFQRSLGRPLGPPVQIGHIFARHFEYLSVKVDLDTEETYFYWSD